MGILSHLFYDACVNLLTKPDFKRETPMRQPMSNILDEHKNPQQSTHQFNSIMKLKWHTTW